jgi:hypothetical protein
MDPSGDDSGNAVFEFSQKREDNQSGISRNNKLADILLFEEQKRPSFKKFRVWKEMVIQFLVGKLGTLIFTINFCLYHKSIHL